MKKIVVLTIVLLSPFILLAQNDSVIFYRNFTVPVVGLPSGKLYNKADICENCFLSLANPALSGSSVSTVRYALAVPDFNNPIGSDIHQSGALVSWNDLSLTGSHSIIDAPYLLISRHSSIGMRVDIASLAITANASVNSYFHFESGSVNQFGFDVMLTNRISDVSSITLFGQLYTHDPYATLATYPFIKTSGFGGYMTFAGDRFSVNIGVERYFDPARRQWVTVPIVTPKIRLAKNLYFEVPVGRLINTGRSSIIPNQPVPIGNMERKGGF